MRWTIAAVLALAGCSGGDDGVPENATVIEPGPGAPVATPTLATEASGPVQWTGRWIGVEGMVLDIAPGNAAGRYSLAMQWDLDHKGTFEGVASSEPDGTAIVFEREGKRETLRPTDGDATGLKYLAGKQNCLTVKPGEGYCRD